MKILLVDDEPCVLDILSKMLRRVGYEVLAVPDGSAALNAFCMEPFDVLMTDLSMPSLDGLCLAKAIRTQSPRQIVVLLSGADRSGGLPPNVDFVLQKPVQLRDLVDLLEHLARISSTPPHDATIRRTALV